MVGAIPEHVVIWAIHKHDSGLGSPRARQWSGAVPEHGSGLGSPRARQWSGPSLSSRYAAKRKERRLYYYLVYLFISLLCQVQSATSGKKKQTDITYHSAFLLFLTNSRLAPVWRCVSVGPLTLSMKRRVHWKRRGAFAGVDLEVVKTTVYGACARPPRILGGRNDGALGYL